MAKMKLKEFMADTKSKGNSKIVSWKEDGNISVFLHPETGIEKRNAHWFPVYKEVEEEKNGKKKKKFMVVNEQVICPGFDECAICQLRSKLRDDKDIEDDDVVLTVGEDNDTMEYCKGDILRTEGFDWKKDLSYKTEYLFGIVNAAKPAPPEIMVAPKSLGKKMTKEIEKQMEEEGEEEGDPFQTPYPFKFTFDKDAMPNDMYDASRTKKFKLTDEIEEFLEADALDLSGLIQPADIGDIVTMVKDAMEATDEDSWDNIGIEIEVPEKKVEKKADKKVKKEDDEPADEKPKTKVKKTVTKETEDPEEDKPKTKTVKKTVKKEEEPPAEKPKGKVKKTVKEKPAVEMIDCPSCGTKVPEDALECPDCGVEYETEDQVKCSECDKLIDKDAESCPHCNADQIPF